MRTYVENGQQHCASCGRVVRSAPASGAVGDFFSGFGEGLVSHEGQACDWTEGWFCASGLTCEDGTCVIPGATPVAHDEGALPGEYCESQGGQWEPDTGECIIPDVGYTVDTRASQAAKEEQAKGHGSIVPVLAVAAVIGAGVITYLFVRSPKDT